MHVSGFESSVWLSADGASHFIAICDTYNIDVDTEIYVLDGNLLTYSNFFRGSYIIL